MSLRHVPCPLKELGGGGLAMTNELDILDVSVSDWMLAIGTRLGQRDDAGHLSMNRPLRTVVLVSGSALQAQSLDALLAASSDYDVVFVESIAHSYSCIRRVMPDLVIISSEVNDVATCELLSMLKVDRRSTGIPVLICPTFGEQTDPDDLAELDQEPSTPSLAAAMN
jgi:PleD family two-component response regulator